MLICVLASLFLTKSASAAPCHDGTTGDDVDVDGWCATDTPISDCDDDLPERNPMMEEDGVDSTDEDCDGSVLTHRTYISSMNILFATDFALGSAAAMSTSPDDVLTFTVGANATANKNDDFAFESGLFTVVLRVKTWTGTPGNCTVRVTSTSMAETSANFAGAGTKVLTWAAVEPGDAVTDLKLACTAGSGSVVLDWITVANGGYRYGPMNDVSSVASTMGLPGTGRQSMVRASDDGTGAPGALMFVGSDVGGFGWSDDGYTWQTANGNGAQWTVAAKLGVWEAWAVDETPLSAQTVLVLTGAKDSGDGGGLYYTDNLDSPLQSWTAANGGLGASKHLDDCSNLDFTPIASGKVIVKEPTDTTNTRFLVASTDPDTTGLWIWDKDSTDTTYFTPVQQTFNSTLPDAPPSALAIDSSGTYLLVGYRPVATGTEQGALYLCPADFDATSVDNCTIVANDTDALWSGDVRDIEADPLTAGTFYVADGGRRWDTSTSACAVGESTVFVVTATGGTSTPTITIYDTDDDTPDSMPTWGGGSGDYYGPYACNDNTSTGIDIYGELVSPKGSEAEGSELSSIAIDPSGEWLFAFYPLPDSVREYGCVRTFRVPVASVATGATPWQPFQGWDYEDMAFYEQVINFVTHAPSANAAARRAHVAVDGFMDSEPLLENWAGAATHDAAFVTDGHNTGTYDLMLGGNFLWRVLQDDTTAVTYGWDSDLPGSVSDTMLDEAEWELAWDGATAVFQDATATSIAVCPGCEQQTTGMVDLMLAAGVADYKMARLHGKAAASARDAADRSCEAHMLDGSGKDVSVWDDGANGQAWMSLIDQDSATDADGNRGILFLSDATTDEWCWDSLAAGGIAHGNYLFDGWTTSTSHSSDTFYELHCQDASELAEYASTAAEWWDPCDPGADPFNLATNDMGQVVSLAATANATAVMAAAPGVPTEGTAAAGDGLWQAQYSATTGIAYYQIPFPAAGVTFGSATCTEEEFFAWNSQVHLEFDPSSDGAGVTGDARAFLSSKHADCGVMQVDWDATVPTDSGSVSWTAVSLGSCTLDVATLRGVTIDRDGFWLFAYGGPDTSAGSGATDGGVCAIDLTGTESPEQVIDGDALNIQFEAGLAHPHIDDTYYFAGYTGEGSTDAGGVFTLQRRYRPDLVDWVWAWRRLSGHELEHRSIVDVAWGTSNLPKGNKLRSLYLATAGGGFWDLSIGSE